MTEPPEPRHPEEGGGEQPPKYGPDEIGPDEIGPDEFFDTDWPQLERDDELIDLLHADDVEISDEAVPGEQDAADVLGGERDRVDRTPLPEKTSPDAVLAEFERRKKSAESPAPRTPTQEGSRRRDGPGHEGRGNLLSLISGYLDNPEAFARPGPEESEPLSLKFTCAACGETVSPNAVRCSQCRRLLRPNDGRRS